VSPQLPEPGRFELLNLGFAGPIPCALGLLAYWTLGGMPETGASSAGRMLGGPWNKSPISRTIRPTLQKSFRSAISPPPRAREMAFQHSARAGWSEPEMLSLNLRRKPRGKGAARLKFGRGPAAGFEGRSTHLAAT